MRSIQYLAISIVLILAQTAQAAQYNLDNKSPYLVAHYMMWFTTPFSNANKSQPGSKPPPPGRVTGDGNERESLTSRSRNNKLPDGHRDIASIVYPAIGPYDSGSRAVIRYHLATMHAAGISIVSSLWYGSQQQHRCRDLPSAAGRSPQPQHAAFSHLLLRKTQLPRLSASQDSR